jgi:hypothetical protein
MRTMQSAHSAAAPMVSSISIVSRFSTASPTQQDVSNAAGVKSLPCLRDFGIQTAGVIP